MSVLVFLAERDWLHVSIWRRKVESFNVRRVDFSVKTWTYPTPSLYYCLYVYQQRWELFALLVTKIEFRLRAIRKQIYWAINPYSQDFSGGTVADDPNYNNVNQQNTDTVLCKGMFRGGSNLIGAIAHRQKCFPALNVVTTMNNKICFTSDFPAEVPESSSLQKWDERSVHLLIEAYENHKALFKKGKMTKKTYSKKIAKYFNETSEVTVTGEQCLRKWSKLEQKFKEIEDHNKRTGNGKINNFQPFCGRFEEQVIWDSPR